MHIGKIDKVFVLKENQLPYIIIIFVLNIYYKLPSEVRLIVFTYTCCSKGVRTLSHFQVNNFC